MIHISKAPKDPDKKKQWVNQMMRIQVAFWVDDGAKCEMCHHRYESVDDFLDKHVRRGYGESMTFVCGSCWDLYEQLQSL